jgi:hypothetical protein
MKAWKIISGILSILLSFVIAIISFLHFFAATVSSSFPMGLFGVLAAFLLFLAGLISLCTCSGYLGGNIATLIFFLLTIAASFFRIYSYPYLLISGIWSGVCALVIFILCFFSRKKNPVDPARMAPQYGGQYYAPQGQPYQAPQYQQPPQGGQYYAPPQAPQYQQQPPQGGQGR